MAMQERETGSHEHSGDKDLDAYIADVDEQIIGKKQRFHLIDLESSTIREVLGLANQHLTALRTILDRIGVVRYDEEVTEDRQGKPRKIYPADKIRALAVVARYVGRRMDYTNVDWDNQIPRIKDALGEKHEITQSLGDIQEDTTHLPRKRVYITIGNGQSRGKDLIEEAGEISRPADHFSDDELVELVTNYRRLPDSVDIVDANISEQHKIWLYHIHKVIRAAYGGTIAEPSLSQYKQSVMRVMRDALQGGRLPQVQEKMKQQELEKKAQERSKVEEVAPEESTEQVVFSMRQIQMPATFREALIADYRAIVESGDTETFSENAFGLTPETYDRIREAAQIILAASDSRTQSRHSLENGTSTAEIRGVIGVCYSYMTEHGLTSLRQLYDKIHKR